MVQRGRHVLRNLDGSILAIHGIIPTIRLERDSMRADSIALHGLRLNLGMIRTQGPSIAGRDLRSCYGIYIFGIRLILPNPFTREIKLCFHFALVLCLVRTLLVVPMVCGAASWRMAFSYFHSHLATNLGVTLVHSPFIQAYHYPRVYLMVSN